ncbi:Uncharacterised protein [uncultured archaeon]|nr:Uncharacterised protein [uncultured archaeon]
MNSYQENKYRKAIKNYTEGSVSLGKASEIAGLPKRLFLYKLKEIGISLNLSERDFMKGMDTLTKARKIEELVAQRNSFNLIRRRLRA